MPPKRLSQLFPGGHTMNYSRLFNWADSKLNIKKRLKDVAIVYVLFLMVSFRKHSLQEAARFSNSSKSRFSILLKNHSDLAIVKLEELSKKQAKQFGRIICFLEDGKLPWRIAIIIDATLQQRSSLHAQNAQKFNHGQGFVIGHQ